MSKVIVKDRGLNKIVSDLRRLSSGPAVKVGVIGGQASQPHEIEGKTQNGKAPNLATVATWLHYGTDFIPPRPFISYPLDARREEIAAFIQKLSMEVAFGGDMTPEQGLKLLGIKAVDMIKTTITKDKPYEPNAPSTIDRKTRAGKKGTTPLVDTGQLLNSITFEVLDAGEKVLDTEGKQ